MVPATGIGVAGAKLRITEAGILPAMRSVEAIAKDTPVVLTVPPVTMNVPSCCCKVLPALLVA